MAARKRTTKGLRGAKPTQQLVKAANSPEESATTAAGAPRTESTLERPGPAVASIGASGGMLDGDAVARHLAAVVESSMHAILSKDLHGTIRTWNRGAERLYGYSPDEAVGRSVQMLVPGDRAEEWSHVMSQLARGEPVEQLETERVRKDGRRIAVALTLSPLRDGNGKLVSASEIGHDITDRKRAEQALRASQQDLAASLTDMARLQAVSTRLVQSGDTTSLLLDIVDAAIALTAADKGNIQLHDRSSGMLTIVASRGFERPFLEFFKEVHEGHAACGTVLQTGKRVVIDDVTASPVFAGTPALDVLLSAGVRAVQTTPLVGRSGRLVGMLSTHYRTPCRLGDRDLHVLDLLARQAADWIERTLAEKAMRESEERFRLTADAAPVLIWMSGTDRQCTWFNKPWLDFVGRPMEQELGNGWAENIHADDYDGCLQTYTTAFDARQPFTMEYRLKRHGGEYRWLLDNGVPFYRADAEFCGYIGSCIDITERRQAEKTIAETYRHLKLAMSAGRMAAWTWDPHKDVVSTSESLREICGVSSIDGREDGESLLHPEDLSRHSKIVDDALRHGTPYQSVFRIVRPDNGQIVWLDLRAVPLTDNDGHVSTLCGVAIDITERKRSEEALRQSEAESRRLLDYHQAVMANLGEGLYTIDTQGLVTYMNPAAESLFGWKRAELMGRRMHDVTHYQHADGRPFPLEGCAEFQVLHQGKVLKDHDDVFIRRDGSFFPVVYGAAPLVSGGQVVGLVIVFRDVTDRKRAEARLRESEARMQAILNTAADAIITMDIHGMIHTVNPASERMFGYAAAEMVGHNVGLLMPSPYREEHDRFLARYLQTGERHIIGIGREFEVRRKDGSIFPVHLVVSEIENRQLFTGILRDMTAFKRLEREVVEVASQQQQRIGQDLHDSVAQEMTALNLLARDLAETLETDPANAPKLVERIQKGLQRGQKELRAFMRGLLPVAVDREGLMAALADLASRTQQESKVTCTFDCPEPIALTDNLTANHLYLIAQEAVHNAVKHSKPQNIWIGLQSNRGLILRVQCNGLRMPARPLATEGLGLRIMRDRAAIIGAHLTIEPAEPTGTVVTCTLVRRNNERKKEETSPSPDRR
jgi:PAS domain S-box-containing protein